ncbi:MAG TPA: hypothetical protein VHH88_04000 [Verrucomicrobiae bacterium]|nr:hypothetical protein [Verrucomicrobiae bacterium]
MPAPFRGLDFSAPVFIGGGNFLVTNPAADPAAFYRLRQPR